MNELKMCRRSQGLLVDETEYLKLWYCDAVFVHKKYDTEAKLGVTECHFLLERGVGPEKSRKVTRPDAPMYRAALIDSTGVSYPLTHGTNYVGRKWPPVPSVDRRVSRKHAELGFSQDVGIVTIIPVCTFFVNRTLVYLFHFCVHNNNRHSFPPAPLNRFSVGCRCCSLISVTNLLV
jgi:hypothetical protein